MSGRPVTIQFNAVMKGTSSISLCYDSDDVWNGNEHWIEVDIITSVNGSSTYTWDTTGVKAGVTIWAAPVDGATPAKRSLLTEPITIVSSGRVLNVSVPTSKTYVAGETVPIQWNADVQVGSYYNIGYGPNAGSTGMAWLLGGGVLTSVTKTVAPTCGTRRGWLREHTMLGAISGKAGRFSIRSGSRNPSQLSAPRPRPS